MQPRYLDLERRRFPDRLRVDIDVEDRVAAAAVPSLILQPLIENAVKHGVSRSTRPVKIGIKAYAAGNGNLTITVEDDAAKTDAEASPGTGTGLKNVADRLAVRFCAGATCLAAALPDGGYRVELTFPLAAARA